MASRDSDSLLTLISQQRGFADSRPPDRVVLPGTQSNTVAGVPQTPILETEKTNTTHIPPSAAPRVPPTPEEVQAAPPTSSNLPPTGAGLANTASTPPPLPKRPRRRFRNFFLTLLILSVGGYVGSASYALIDDDFHDFFTEYYPFGEDVIAFFEEREFRKRFPVKSESTQQSWPQRRGESKVTISRSSGLSPRVAATQDGEKKDAGSDAGQKGPRTSALDDKGAQHAQSGSGKEKPKAADAARRESPAPKEDDDTQKSGPSSLSKQIDHLNVAQATEPVVQDVIKMVNNIITAVNASPEASKYSSTISSAKEDLDKIIGDISTLKEQAAQDAHKELTNAHSEFDSAAKELVRRLDTELREQEAKWREEYESEREKLSNAYQSRLSSELDVAKKVADTQQKNALLEQEIALQKTFTDSVKASIEAERDGRLAKLDELSSSVSELEKLTGQWNDVVDANQRTQHLHVALDAVRNAVEGAEHPTPFVDELVAVKQISRDNNVVNAAVASINPAAYQRGIPTSAHLIDRFRRVAGEVRKASLLPEDAGVASHAASALVSRLMFSKKSDRGLPEGDDVEATLARTETMLEEGDLEAAAREMNGLKGWAGVLSRDWVAEVRRVLEVKQAVDVSLFTNL